MMAEDTAPRITIYEKKQDTKVLYGYGISWPRVEHNKHMVHFYKTLQELVEPLKEKIRYLRLTGFAGSGYMVCKPNEEVFDKENIKVYEDFDKIRELIGETPDPVPEKYRKYFP